MFCKNCGNEIDSSLNFCAKCGTRLTEGSKISDTKDEFQNNIQNVSAVDDKSQNTDKSGVKKCSGKTNEKMGVFGEIGHVETETAPKIQKKKGKNKKRLLKVVVSFILIFAIVGGVLAHPVWRNSLLRSILSEKTYFKLVMGTNINGYLDEASSDISMIKKIIDGKSSINMEVQMELGKGAKDYIDKSAGLKVSPLLKWVKSVGLNFDAGRTGDVYGLGLGLVLNEKSLAEADVVMKNKGVYVSVPTLSDTGVQVIPETPKQKANNKKTSQTLERVGNLVPQEGVITDMITRYALCIVNNTKNIKEEDFLLKAGGISQKAIGMTMELDGESMLDISRSCLEKAKDDKDIKDIIEKACKKGMINQKFDVAYKGFQQGISDSLETINNTTLTPQEKEKKLPLRFIANNRGELIGMDILSDDLTFKYYNIKNGNKHGKLISVKNDIYNISYEGCIESKDEKYNGAYNFSTMGVNVFDVTFENVDQAKCDNGILNGKIIVQSSDGYNKFMSENGRDNKSKMSFSNVKYVIDSNATQKYKGNANVEFTADGKEFAKYNIKYDLTEKREYKVPQSCIKSTDGPLMKKLEEQWTEAIFDRLGDVGLPSYLKYFLFK